MWIVFNRQDSWVCGYSVANEAEAVQICKADDTMDYCYVGSETMAYCM